MAENYQPNKIWSGRFRELLNRTFEIWQQSLVLSIALFASFWIVPASAYAQAARPQGCSQREINHLETESEHIRNWPMLRAFYYRYSTCKVEDAEVETGIGTSVVRMLLHNWGSLSSANQLFLRDPGFKTFTLAGLNITDATDDLNRIDMLAAKSCAPSLHNLCRDIRAAIRENK